MQDLMIPPYPFCMVEFLGPDTSSNQNVASWHGYFWKLEQFIASENIKLLSQMIYLLLKQKERFMADVSLKYSRKEKVIYT